MVKFSAYAVATALGAFASVTDAHQDSNHYPGFTNPNLKDSHYYADAVNVLQGIELGKFEKLYISFRSCVWSEYGMGGENRQDNNQDGDAVNCGSQNGGDQHWYMGRTACFRANAAFELYGVLAGSSESGCHKGTFINSFFTRMGPDTVGDAFGLDNTYVNAACINNGGNDDAAGDDGWGNNENTHNVLANSKDTSSATGCSSDGKFQVDTFQGSYCDGLHYISTTTSASDLSTYNEAMENLSCTAIYDASAGIDLATAILTYSQACSISEFPGVCGDPHGVIAARQKKLVSAAAKAHQVQLKKKSYNPIKHSQGKSVGAMVMNGFSVAMMLLGFGLFVTGYLGSRKIKSPSDQDEPQEPETTLPVIREISRTVSEVSQKVARTVSEVSHQVVDKIQEYAEEDDEPVVGGYGMGETQAPAPTPSPMADPVSPAASFSAPAPVVTASVVAAEPEKKKKRPRLAKLSKRLFGSRKK